MGTLTGYDSRIAYLVLDCYSFVHTDGCRKCNATILSFRDYASHPRVRCIHRPATAARHRILPTLERPTLPVPPRSGHGTTVCTVLDATAGNVRVSILDTGWRLPSNGEERRDTAAYL